MNAIFSFFSSKTPPSHTPESHEAKEPLFQREDWIAAAATFLFSGFVFLKNMAPEVTLQDSGELVTGAFTFGVPHPPGYPLWAFLGYIWSHAIVPFGNPAWRIGSMSAFTGALTVGIMTLMMTCSTRILLKALPWTKTVDTRINHWLALCVGASASLLFGFNRGVWLWASVSEMRVLNAFSFILITCFFFAWMMRPQRKGFLYAALLTYGLSMTNHQTVAVMAGALVVGTFALGLDQYFDERERAQLARSREGTFALLMRALSTFCDLTVAVLLSLATVFSLFAWLKCTETTLPGELGIAKIVVLALAGITLLIVGRYYGWVNPRYTLIYTLLFISGCALYFYMPLASSTNPPMNWGFTSTKEGFLHAITRGQYEKLQGADPFSDIFHIQLWVFIRGLIRQYSLPLAGFGLVTLLVSTYWLFKHLVQSAQAYRWIGYSWLTALPLSMIGVIVFRSVFLKLPPELTPALLIWGFALATLFILIVGLWLYLNKSGRAWAIFVWSAFLASSLGLILIINPKLDRQEQEITIKFFAPAHGFYAMLIGYGIALTYSFVLSAWTRLPRVVAYLACAALLALPIITYRTNWSLCALGTHDFGYQFGYRMFCPGDGYPDMEKDAVLFGGTDPGRFVPTYMIFCESQVKPKDRYQSPFLPESKGSEFDRSDVYIITQNALADGTYMNYIRDHYDYSRPNPNDPKTLEKFLPWQRWVFKTGWTLLDRQNDFPKQPIRIPSPDDNSRAFQQFVTEVQNGTRPNRGDIVIENGRVQVTGALAVMEINGILAKYIFDWNKDKHAFYVEESYVIPWMYPYLRPSGVIMRIEKETLPSPQENQALWKGIFDKDKAYWDKLVKDFTAREEFRRNADAKKSFSKMRVAIAGLYLWRNMLPEAEYAFKQSLELCPESPESSFRLAELYMSLRRFDEARSLIKTYLTYDEYNNNAHAFLKQIDDIAAASNRRDELIRKLTNAPTLQDMMELLSVYHKLNARNDMINLCRQMLGIKELPPQALYGIGQALSAIQQPDMALQAYQRYTQAIPQDFRGFIEVGWIELSRGQHNNGYQAWQRAVTVGGETARQMLRTDARFAPLWQQPNLPRPFFELIQGGGRRNALGIGGF